VEAIQSMSQANLLSALVRTMRLEADGVISLELCPVSGSASFPAFEPGSHIDLHLPNGLVRSYSLLNDARERQRYVVAVLNDRHSRGGSRCVHEQLRVGAVLPISAPRNNFALQPTREKQVLVAGGIGVTPLLAMLRQLVAQDGQVDFIYCARTRQQAAFLSELEALAGERIRLVCHFDDEQGTPPALQHLLAGYAPQTHFYCCGPTPMLDAFEKVCEALGYANAHIERFAAVAAVPAATAGYSVELRRSGRTVSVLPGQSVLDALLAAGLNPDHSCREGVCGACETRVLCGEVEHHDGILTKAERAANKSMMICVSHVRGANLVLDL